MSIMACRSDLSCPELNVPRCVAHIFLSKAVVECMVFIDFSLFIIDQFSTYKLLFRNIKPVIVVHMLCEKNWQLLFPR